MKQDFSLLRFSELITNVQSRPEAVEIRTKFEKKFHSSKIFVNALLNLLSFLFKRTISMVYLPLHQFFIYLKMIHIMYCILCSNIIPRKKLENCRTIKHSIKIENENKRFKFLFSTKKKLHKVLIIL